MKYLPFVLILFVFACATDEEMIPDEDTIPDADTIVTEEVPSLTSFVGDFDKIIYKLQVHIMGENVRDTIFETISISQVNDTLFNYKISNTNIDDDLLYDRKIDGYYLYLSSRFSNSNYSSFKHYPSEDSIFVFTRSGGLGRWTEYETFIKL